jgi:hypothetical protein
MTHLKEQIFKAGFHMIEPLGSVVLDAFAKFRKATICVAMSAVLPACPSVRPSAWNCSASTGRIVMAFDI